MLNTKKLLLVEEKTHSNQTISSLSPTQTFFFKKSKIKTEKKKKIQPTNAKRTNALLSSSSFLPKIISPEIETEASELSSGMKRRVAPRVGKANK